MPSKPMPLARVGLALGLTAWALLVRHSPRAAPVAAPPSQDAEVPAWAVDVAGTPEGAALTGKRLVVPKEPLTGQKRGPPCPPAYEVINGGCWMKAAAKPTPACPDTLWQHGDGCYLPLLATTPPPSSLGR